MTDEPTGPLDGDVPETDPPGLSGPGAGMLRVRKPSLEVWDVAGR